MGKKMNVWDAIIHNGQHHVFRLVSLVFSVVSAWAIYWFFSALGSSLFQQVVTIGTSAGFVALGYFVTRGLAHRMLNHRRIRSYAVIAVLYIIVEVTCNFGHAAAAYPDVAWIHRLSGWQFTFFSVMLPVVLSIIPLFNIALAVIDVDMMQEKGIVVAQPAPVGSQPKTSFAPQSGMSPQMGYPSLPGAAAAPAGKGHGQAQAGQNALASWWQGRKQQPAPAAPVAGSSNGVIAGIP
jgi:hypothetical protein